MKYALRLLLAAAVAMAAGLALSSATGAQRAAVPSCNELNQSWKLAYEVHVDAETDTAELVWNPGKVAVDRSVTTRSADGTHEGFNPWARDVIEVQPEHRRVSINERNCAQAGLDDFLDQVADDTAAIHRGDCRLLLDQDRIARSLASPDDLVVGIPSPRAGLDGSGAETITYDLEGSRAVVAECEALLASGRNG